MTYTELAGKLLPGFLRAHILHFEAVTEKRVASFAAALPEGARLLDAGAGEGQFAHLFRKHRYCGVDLAIGDTGWNYARLDAVADLQALPFRADCFDAAIHINTLEHVREPVAVMREIGRTLAPGGRLILVAPFEWEVHQSPHDYFRYTRHGMRYVLERAGFDAIEVEPLGGYFRLLARRLLNGLKCFSGGARWILYVPAAIVLAPPALILPCFDFLDRKRDFTLGYICTAQKKPR